MLKGLAKVLLHIVKGYYGNSGYMYNNTYNTINNQQAKGLGLILMFFVLLIIILGIVSLVGFYKLAKKLNHPNPWWAFVPILNIVQMLQIADLSPWYILGLFIPYVGVLIPLIAYYKITQKVGANMTTSLIIALIIPFYWPYYILKNVKNINSNSQQTVNAQTTDISQN